MFRLNIFAGLPELAGNNENRAVYVQISDMTRIGCPPGIPRSIRRGSHDKTPQRGVLSC